MATASDYVPVELGFVEECDRWKLSSKYFVSKIGGKPAWLDLKELPSSSDLKCLECKKPCVFLLQVYAPLDGKDMCFHRTIFIFVCKNPNCCKPWSNRNFKVFRCQLPRKNESYNFDPYEEDENDEGPSAEDFNDLCRVCGCLGPLRCSQCHVAYYCCKDHQKTDWVTGHKNVCSKIEARSDLSKKVKCDFLLPEYEIVTEPEPEEEIKKEKTEEEKIAEFNQFMQSDKAKNLLPNNCDRDSYLKGLARSPTKEDLQFEEFVSVIKREPDQILRYQRSGHPLWISSQHIPEDEDIEKCFCGSRRQFEFQVMPQLLNHLKLDSIGKSIDWGVLAVFTCTESCNRSPAYKSEVLWKQDV